MYNNVFVQYINNNNGQSTHNRDYYYMYMYILLPFSVNFHVQIVHVHVHVVILSQIGLTVNWYRLLYLHPIIYFSYIVFSELLNRVLGLEGDECDPVESKMTVTVFQFAAYFLSIGSTKAIPKSLKQVAQESESFSECLQVFII